jgi:hypothetical protein
MTRLTDAPPADSPEYLSSKARAAPKLDAVSTVCPSAPSNNRNPSVIEGSSSTTKILFSVFKSSSLPSPKDAYPKVKLEN